MSDSRAIVNGIKVQLTEIKEMVTELTSAMKDAGFRVGPDLLGKPTLWCTECGRDSGFHWEACSKSKR
jgi:hypothetical protein